MREIKFRAWDKLDNKMVDVAYINHRTVWFDRDDQRVHEDYVQLGTGYSAEVMQYTGLKDKNGVEIYEGDVVKNDLISWSHEVDVAQVLFNEGAYYLIGNHGYHVQMRSKHSPNMEVIGNIYENPELLPPPQSGEKE